MKTTGYMMRLLTLQALSQCSCQTDTLIYALTRQEITRGIANRFVYSRMYSILYLVMAALSVTTVVLSLVDGCPGLPFYILEVIINSSMIIEVGIRFVAFGSQFWKSYFNVLDLVITAFCALTILVIFFAGCGETSKGEEIIDTLLLVVRNVLQFIRLATVMRQSGKSMFSGPRPIDLGAARGGYDSLDVDIEAEEESGQPLTRDSVVFDAEETTGERTKPLAVDVRDAEDLWAELG